MIVFGMCVKGWSATQKVVARSSGEAELYAAVRGASEALCLRSMARELGWNWTICMWTDSSACKGTCNRSGLGKMKHLDVETLFASRSGQEQGGRVEQDPRRGEHGGLVHQASEPGSA